METQLKKNNIILAIGIDNVIHFKISNENINTKNFLEFIKEMKNQHIVDVPTKYFIIMDNLPLHKNNEIIKFLVESILNVIFKAPYCSIFNSVELSFRTIKRKIYSNIYTTIEEINEEIKKYLEDKEITKQYYLIIMKLYNNTHHRSKTKLLI